ncbi:helix-turn-helix transcriptional regulator [Lacticaseibacillus mingshuiensis]|uniref:Helix-turn-helix transcriptional regulator n=1 Tax=Lacticaseibacillus mingshuiensis TaxID=2799574 RepID=A0ABW4CMT7_9LACO|nr:WYL domain-containing protein [Lacticaseibacillus mingshuiensis]
MSQANRLNLELAFLADKATFQLQDLMHEFAISKRTALRDVAALEEMGLPLYSEVGASGGYRLTPHHHLVPVYFNNQEVSAIFFALDALKNLSATPFSQTYPNITTKLLATLATPQQNAVRTMSEAVHYYSGPSLAHPRFLNDLLDAIVIPRTAMITVETAPLPVLVQPYELLYRNGIWFCEMAMLADQRWRTLRIDQVQSLTVSEVPPLDRATLRARQQAYEASHHNIAFRCELSAVGKEKFEKNHYPNMHVRQTDAGYELYGGYNQDEFTYMLEYLLGLGAEVTVLAPATLRTEYRKRLQAMLARYQA